MLLLRSCYLAHRGQAADPMIATMTAQLEPRQPPQRLKEHATAELVRQVGRDLLLRAQRPAAGDTQQDTFSLVCANRRWEHRIPETGSLQPKAHTVATSSRSSGG